MDTGCASNDINKLVRRFVEERRVARARRQSDMDNAQRSERQQQNARGGRMLVQGDEDQGEKRFLSNFA